MTILPFWLLGMFHISMMGLYLGKEPPPPPTEREILTQGEFAGIYGKPKGTLLCDCTLIGPHVGLSIPHGIKFGLETLTDKTYGGGLDYSFIPTIATHNIEFSMHTIEGRAMWFPYQRSFFVGLGLGDQTLSAAKSQSIMGQTVKAKVEIDTMYLTPLTGWRWQWSSGWVIGFDLGWQFAISSSTTVDTKGLPQAIIDSTTFTNLKSSVVDQGNNLGRTGLPLVSLIQVGYWF